MESIKLVTKKLEEFAQSLSLWANMEKTNIYFGGIEELRQ